MTAIQDLRVHAPVIIAEAVCLIVFCSFMVGLRFYARWLKGSRLGMDDLAIALALLFVIAMAITILIETGMKGFGYSAAVGDTGPNHPDANVAGWPTELLQVPALGCIKLSFLFFYRRVFIKFVAREFSFVNLFMIAAVSAWTICFFFLLLFLCNTDFAAYWTSGTTEAERCLPTGMVHMGYAISDVVTDIIIILMPVGEIWKLHLPVRRKFAVMGVFGMGAITIAMSIVRMVIYQRALSVQFDPDADEEYLTTLTTYFSMLEAGLGVMAACLPVQYGLFRSEKVQSMIRSIHSLTSLGSRGSGGSGNNSRTRSFYTAQSRGQSQSQNLNTAGEVSDAGGEPIPASVRNGSDAGTNSHLETQGIVVPKSFGTEEHAAQNV
ncbi:uncharacterized protein TRUGW13939_00567 [Talaromyces rugulosus]|uniref:Rhodopsin domain-containing protein n=1 Tax=Talaromyces rugulosus TaxID=121627 RepID=A0A7H8QHN1_TALRU|nr:uncharacterized protein TRUGW13939_00567 [Talaromyces rugulosus]QKX53488.1 hypothetical protein TRUGW13939_00567 [Talaromyces rugulosus]